MALFSDYKTNFKISQDSSKWQISIVNPLNMAILNYNPKLAIPITANKAGASTLATPVLNSTSIKFDNLYYAASYFEGTDGESAKLTEYITATGID